MTRLASLFLLAFSSASPETWQAVEVNRHGDQIDVMVGGKPFTTYCFGSEAAKPYLFPLRSAQGTVVTRSFPMVDRKSTRLNSSHLGISYAVFCLKKKKNYHIC